MINEQNSYSLDLKVPEEMRSIKEGKAEIFQKDGNGFVGEYHLRLRDDRDELEAASTVLNEADTIFIEFDSSYDNSYTQNSPFLRYMELAQIFAVQGGKELVIFNDSLPENRFQLWEEAGIALSQEEVIYADALYYAQMLMAPILRNRAQGKTGQNEMNQETMIIELVQYLEKRYRGADAIDFSSFASSAIKIATICLGFGSVKFFDTIRDYMDLEFKVRDLFYHKMYKAKLAESPDSKLAAVVGIRHSEAIKAAIEQEDFSIEADDKQLKNIKDFYIAGSSF